jgi:hypothetical protein
MTSPARRATSWYPYSRVELNTVDSGQIQASTAAETATQDGKMRLPTRQVTTAISTAKRTGVRLSAKAEGPMTLNTAATT